MPNVMIKNTGKIDTCICGKPNQQIFYSSDGINEVETCFDCLKLITHNFGGLLK